VQQQAQWFMSALTTTRGWRLTANRLQLLDERGGELATLVAQSQALAGSQWSATGINNGKGGVSSLQAGSTVTLDFGADGTVSGSAGCNSYTGRYENTAGKVKFPNVFATTRKMCVDAGVMEQEQALLKALGASTTVRIEGGRLELRDAGGALQISASGT
jgi:heat shock protein HslJ